MGQANVWYADDGELNPQFRDDVRRYVATRTPPLLPTSQDQSHTARQPDPLRRAEVEHAAVRETVAHYKRLGYIVTSFEKDNLGWDLEAAHPNRNLTLKLEVKGLSGTEPCIDVTPNEYACMSRHRDEYRLCIVTETLPCHG